MTDAEKKVKTPFFKGVKTEFKKISWPDKSALVKQSIAIVTISVIVGLIITLFDTIIQYGVNILTTWN